MVRRMQTPTAVDATLRDVIQELAPVTRGAGTPGEREAAGLLRDRFERMGVPARVEEELYDHGYARLHGLFAATGVVAGALAATGRARPFAFAAGLAAALAGADDAANGWRPARRVLERRRTTWNVVAEVGAHTAERTLVVLAHHDAAPTGFVFDDTLQRKVHERFPELIERTDTALPMWWPTHAGPLLAAAGALTGRRGLARAGATLSAASAVALADIARDRIVPGAGDNLTGVAVLVGLAARLQAEPVDGLRVVLASCGAEEVLQGGIYGFTARHLKGLDPAATWVLNVDTVGSPRLVMLEGEGTLWVEDYREPAFRDLIAAVAEAEGIPLRRGLRARTSSDAVVPSRAGFPTAMLCSVNAWKAIDNYHKPSDVPENVHYETVAAALSLSEALARRLAR